MRDLPTWMRLELANGSLDGAPVIDAAALAATHVPLMARGKNPVTGGASFYGLGWNVEFGRHGVSWGHAGAFSNGGRTVVSLLPESNLGIVVLANAFPTGLPEALADSFLDLVFDGNAVAGLSRAVERALRKPLRPANRGGPGDLRDTARSRRRRRCRAASLCRATTPTPMSARRRWSRKAAG